MSDWINLDDPRVTLFLGAILPWFFGFLLKRLREYASRILSNISSKWAMNSAIKEARILLRSRYLRENPTAMMAWVGSRIAILIFMVVFIIFFSWMAALPFSGGADAMQFVNRFVAASMMGLIAMSIIAILGSEIDAMGRMTDMQAMSVASAGRIKGDLIKSGKTEEEATQMVERVLKTKSRIMGPKDDPFAEDVFL